MKLLFPLGAACVYGPVMRNFVIASALFGLLALAVVTGVVAWADLGVVEISLIGWLAMAGGVLLSLLVGGGLMALVFYSARSGHDDAAQPRRHGDDHDDSDQ